MGYPTLQSRYANNVLSIERNTVLSGPRGESNSVDDAPPQQPGGHNGLPLPYRRMFFRVELASL
ncbi:hypothetical protein QQX98_008407 [Neonectria punicea]|uniref:Uncharacterized protein n=1 Tax=Neonectria punicea TaxID=979145 RepID=A0ABR1GV27_9HYPO